MAPVWATRPGFLGVGKRTLGPLVVIACRCVRVPCYPWPRKIPFRAYANVRGWPAMCPAVFFSGKPVCGRMLPYCLIPILSGAYPLLVGRSGRSLRLPTARMHMASIFLFFGLAVAPDI